MNLAIYTKRLILSIMEKLHFTESLVVS